MHQLEQAASGEVLTEYHLEAGIAACHAVAETYETTNWQTILFYYDNLVLISPSPIMRLNRAVAVAMVHGPQAGIAILEELIESPQLKNYYLLPATFGELYQRLGQSQQATNYYPAAFELTTKAATLLFLIKKMQNLRDNGSL